MQSLGKQMRIADQMMMAYTILGPPMESWHEQAKSVSLPLDSTSRNRYLKSSFRNTSKR